MEEWTGNAVWVYFKGIVPDNGHQECMHVLQNIFHDTFDIYVLNIEVYLYHTPTVYIAYFKKHQEALFFTKEYVFSILQCMVYIRPIMLFIKKNELLDLIQWKHEVEAYTSIWKCVFIQVYTLHYALLYTIYDSTDIFPSFVLPSSLCMDKYPIYTINYIASLWAYGTFYEARNSIQEYVTTSCENHTILDVAHITETNIKRGVYVRVLSVSYTDFQQIETTAINILSDHNEKEAFKFLKHMFVVSTRKEFEEWLNYTRKIVNVI